MKHEKDSKISLYPYCFDCGFKTFQTINEEKLSDLWKNLGYIMVSFEGVE